MHWGLCISSLSELCRFVCVANFVPEEIVAGSTERESQQISRIAGKSNLNASHFMQLEASQGRARDRGAVKVNAPQTVGSKCVHCGGELGSRMAMDSHHRHCSSKGTQRANPDSCKSLSFTVRADMSSGILRHTMHMSL